MSKKDLLDRIERTSVPRRTTARPGDEPRNDTRVAKGVIRRRRKAKAPAPAVAKAVPTGAGKAQPATAPAPEPPRPTGPDPRTLDSVFRYALPHPLAALYRQRYAHHLASRRLAASILLAEGVVRFLALTALADAVPLVAHDKTFRSWMKLLVNAGFGKWLRLFRQTTSHAARVGPPFVPELAALVDGPWFEAADTLRSFRNGWSHKLLATQPESVAEELKQSIDEPLRVLLSGVLFLSDYALGEFVHADHDDEAHRYHFYGMRGLDPTQDPTLVESARNVPTNKPVLVRADGSVLRLEPLLRVAHLRAPRLERLVWLEKVRSDSTMAVFHNPQHPAWETEQDLEGWLHDKDRWRGVAEPGFSPASLKAMLASTQTPTGRLPEAYTLIGLIGQGGMGQVWEAEHKVLRRRVALKILRQDLVASATARRRFEREARLLEQLDHPAIVTIHTIQRTADGTPFIEMELVSGEDLQEILDRDGPMSVPEALAAFEQVLEALAYVHAHGTCHRDLKPSNFLRSATGIRMIDFGIASVDGGTRYTRTLAVMGSEGYRAPEQANPRHEASPRMDIYGAGCLLFALLKGHPPSPMSATHLDQELPDTPPALRSILARAMAYAPEDRFDGANALASALDAMPVADFFIWLRRPAEGGPDTGSVDWVAPADGLQIGRLDVPYHWCDLKVDALSYREDGFEVAFECFAPHEGNGWPAFGGAAPTGLRWHPPIRA